jgi:hypothetical protein
MSTLFTYGAVVAIVVAIAWISIRTAVREARKAGAAETDAAAQEAGRKLEGEMTDIQSETITDNELKDRLKKGTFGGQEP